MPTFPTSYDPATEVRRPDRFLLDQGDGASPEVFDTMSVTFEVLLISLGLAKLVTASEALTARNLVNLWTDSGVAKARQADANSADKDCDGFVLDAAGPGDAVLVFFWGEISGFSSLTDGAPYYLDAAGAAVTVAAGTELIQRIGKATSDTTILFRPESAARLNP